MLGHFLLKSLGLVVPLVCINMQRIIAHALGRGQQYASRFVPAGIEQRPRARQRYRRSHAIVQLVAVNLIARRSNLFFQVEINLFQARLHLLQGKDRFVNHHHPQRRGNPFTSLVGHPEFKLGLCPGQVRLAVAADFYAQIIGRVNQQEPAVAYDNAVFADEIRVDLHRSG